MFSKHRIEALSDAVFAIAMTLLILDIKLPPEIAPGSLDHSLRALSHEWVSFAITFGLTSVYWTLQHRVFDLLDKVSSASLAVTFVFLGFITILPFSTALWGHHITEPVAFMVYFLNQFLIAAALWCKLEIARVQGHVHSTPGVQTMRVRLAFFCGIMLVAFAASRLLPIADLWMPLLPLALAGRLIRNRLAKAPALNAA